MPTKMQAPAFGPQPTATALMAWRCPLIGVLCHWLMGGLVGTASATGAVTVGEKIGVTAQIQVPGRAEVARMDATLHLDLSQLTWHLGPVGAVAPVRAMTLGHGDAYLVVTHPGDGQPWFGRLTLAPATVTDLLNGHWAMVLWGAGGPVSAPIRLRP